jgi:acetylornithine deacetylase
VASPVIETLEQLVGFPTVSNRPVTEIAAFLAERSERAGWRVEHFETEPGKANVLCYAGPEANMEQGLLVSGHMDVVPVAGQPWETDPFRLTEKDGLLYGRGTTDMKGFIAATVEALSGVDTTGLVAPVVLAWTHDEEVGCLGSAHLARHFKATGRQLPKHGLIGEPTDFRMVRMHAGHVTCRIRTTGESAHSSKPDLGASAIKAILPVLSMLESLEVELHAERRLEKFLERPWVSLNIGTIQGGSAVNLVPDQCEVVVGYRPLPGDDPLSVANRIENRIRELPGVPGTEIAFEVESVSPGMLTPEHTELQALLTPHASEPGTCSAPFATDAGNLETLGVSSLVFGPGSIDVAHKANEYISAAALEKTVGIIEQLVRTRLG